MYKNTMMLLLNRLEGNWFSWTVLIINIVFIIILNRLPLCFGLLVRHLWCHLVFLDVLTISVFFILAENKIQVLTIQVFQCQCSLFVSSVVFNASLLYFQFHNVLWVFWLHSYLAIQSSQLNLLDKSFMNNLSTYTTVSVRWCIYMWVYETLHSLPLHLWMRVIADRLVNIACLRTDINWGADLLLRLDTEAVCD